MTNSLLQAYARPVPRYTSYPTAPHFSDAVGALAHADWLGRLRAGMSLSLYAHIPFCDTLCWFCGCHTKITRRYRPVAAYLDGLKKEIAAAAALIDPGCKVEHVHWGGGSPTILNGDDLRALADAMRSAFSFDERAEFAVEIDPRGLEAEELDALAAVGVTRASIGVQDFNPEVQQAINRVQPFAETRAVIDGLRTRGIRAVNIDLMYGLPNQTAAGISDTIDKVLTLAPDRIALFGYAHVPWMRRHQQMIPEASLPGVEERFAQADLAARLLVEAGYRRIGLDHFARADDPLALAAASGTLRRNFQGYTTDSAEALIGFGASAIGRLPQGFVQNRVAIADYLRHVEKTGLATARGYAFTRDDLRRAHLIERLMCDMSLSWSQVERQIGPADDLRAEAEEPLSAFARDGLIRVGRDGFAVTERGRPFVRTICSAFDAYLKAGQARHSIAV